MKQVSHYIWTSLFIIFLVCPSFATENKPQTITDYQPDGLYIENITLDELDTIFQIYKYNDYIYMPDWMYPPIFLKNLPLDFDKMTDTTQRNKIFLQILGPLALKLSDEIKEERLKILELQMALEDGKELTHEQEQYIEDKAKEYDIFTRLKGFRRYQLLLKHLVLKVDVVPPSLLMAAAAMESDWGTSRPAREANSLYKELVWYGEEGLDPKDETEDNSYKYKIFPSLYESMKSFAHKVNTSVNYEQFRFQRAEIKRHDKPVLGRSVAHTFIFNSALKNFAGILDYTITFYELTNFDESELGYIDIPKNTEDKKQ